MSKCTTTHQRESIGMKDSDYRSEDDSDYRSEDDSDYRSEDDSDYRSEDDSDYRSEDDSDFTMAWKHCRYISEVNLTKLGTLCFYHLFY